jgi:hypothetical protein
MNKCLRCNGTGRVIIDRFKEVVKMMEGK